ncbi:hypothetical protein [Brumimicrobium oceani]|uniref:Uncharacterized protein n=1 Tax=Brumimicrobium oceani TaxID=2100725 RepID=A0A2U2XFG2_9FLAO|nr:hypothetical protein [Brumimicrobium oceani]PWH86542.1 hypothetical protein DIT68_04710 [Brumimicrobium oceani]
MRQFFLLLFFFIVYFSYGQHPPITPKPEHSFSLAGGVFAQTGTKDYAGVSSSLTYQVLFPNRYIFGLEFKTDQSFFKSFYSSNPNKTLWSRVEGYSGTIQIGVNLLRRKKLDFAMFVIPHFNYQKYINKVHIKDIDEYQFSHRSETYFFLPLLLFRAELYYRQSELHGFGLVADVSTDFEADGLGDVLGAGIFAIGRFMLSYRYTLPIRDD